MLSCCIGVDRGKASCSFASACVGIAVIRRGIAAGGSGSIGLRLAASSLDRLGVDAELGDTAFDAARKRRGRSCRSAHWLSTTAWSCRRALLTISGMGAWPHRAYENVCKVYTPFVPSSSSQADEQDHSPRSGEARPAGT